MHAFKAPESTSLLLIAMLLLLAAPLGVAHDQSSRGDAAAADHSARVELPASEAPRVSMVLTPAGGAVLEAQLTLDRFRFAKERAGGAHSPGEGHAHLNIDDEKVASIFSPLFRLPTLGPGIHEVEVSLRANDHSAYVVGGAPIAARVILRSRPGARPEDVGAFRDFDLDVRGGTVADDTLRVTQGEGVRLNWSSDAPADLHLHGYDIEAQVAPGQPVTMQFVADVGGRFPVARHGAGDEAGGHGHQALLYLEVYPD